MTPSLSLELLQDRASGVLMIRFGSRLDLQKLIRGREMIVAAEGAVNGVIIDFSAVVDFEMAPGDLHAIARMEPATKAPRIVVAPNPVIYGSARVVELLRDEEGGGLTVVSGLAEAFSILRISSPHFTPLTRAA